MVKPGASSEDIRSAVFETFESKLEESDIDDHVAETILSTVLADNPPHEFSDELSEVNLNCYED